MTAGPSAPAARDQKPHSNQKEATQPHALQGYTDSLLQQELQQYHPLAGVKNLQYKPQTYASLLHERPVRSPGPCRRARWFPQKSLGFIGLGFRAYRDIGFRV